MTQNAAELINPPVLARSEPGAAKGLEDVHLIHVVRQYDPMVGGLEDFVKNLIRQQQGRFASLEVVTLDRLFTEPDRVLPAVDEVEGVPVVRIPFRGSTRYPIATDVFSKIRGADLVHVHAVDFFFDALALGSPVQGIPLVATSHGGFFHTGKFAALKKIWFHTATRITANRYRAIACCSESDLDTFKKVAPRKATLIENGVDLDKFADASSQIPQKHIVTIGRFSSNKRPDVVIDMMRVLVDRDPEWKLSLIGGASDWSVEALQARIAERGLVRNVEVFAGLSDAAIRRHLAGASFFVSASDYEGFGLALIEAMSAGLVPVVHPNAAFMSLAHRHPLVTLADFSKPDEVIGKLMQSWQGLTGSTSATRHSLMTAAANHSWPETAVRYEAFYQTALDRAGI